MFEQARARGFEVLALHHAEAILTHDMPEAASELERVLLDVRIPIEELVRGGAASVKLVYELLCSTRSPDAQLAMS